MATNTFYNVSDITKMAMQVIEADCTMAKHVNRGYDDRFKTTGAKIGDTANIRIPGYGTLRTGKVAVPTATNQTYASVTLNQFGADLLISSKELTLNVDEFMDFLRPQIECVVNKIDSDLVALYTQVALGVGTPGTRPTDLLPIGDAKAALTFAGAPMSDRSIVLNPSTEAALVNSYKGLFNPVSEISRQYTEGTMGQALGFKFSSDRNMGSHTFGTWAGTPLMNGSTADGATQIVTNGWSSGASALKKGDILTIAGVYSVNPVGKGSTGQLRQFVVTEDCNDTTGNMTIKISPSIILTGPTQNVSALPLTGAAITPLSATAKTSPINLAFHKDAFLLASADLAKVGPSELCSRVRSPKLNMGIRLVKFYDGRNDDELYRLDVLYGVTVLRPDFCVRIQG